MQQSLRLLLIAWIAISVQGCALALSRVKFSQATVADHVNNTSDNGLLDVGELTLSVAPRNMQFGLTLAGPIPALIIPLPSPTPNYPKDYFVIELFLQPKNRTLPTGAEVSVLCDDCVIDTSTFSLDPARITLKTDDGKSYSPVAYSRPHLNTRPKSTPPLLGPLFNMNPIISQWKIDYYCNAPPSGDFDFENVKGAVEFSDSAYLVLKFDVPPPAPDRSFVLSIGGALTKADADIPIPPVHFQSASGWMRMYR